MAIRTINYTVASDEITPATLQPGGEQNEHKATLLRFNFNDEFWSDLQSEKENVEGSVLIYRIVGVDGIGGEHSSDVSVLDEQTVEYYLERCITKYGGKIKVQFVISLYKDGVAVSEPRTSTVELQLKASPVHCGEHEDGETVSALAYGAKESAKAATEAAEQAEKMYKQTEQVGVNFEDAEFVFLGGNASSGGSKPFVVEDKVINGSKNLVSGGAVFNAIEAVNNKITNNNDSLEKYADDAAGSVKIELDTFKNSIATIIVESGTKEIKNDNGETLYTWSYIKLANGFAMCWGIFDITPKEDNQYGKTTPIYYSEFIKFKTPFGLTDVIISGSATNYYYICNGGIDSKNPEIVGFRLSRAYEIKDDAPHTRVLVLGKWKELETNAEGI